ncbi:hypothetical protein PYK79_18420 [Streptomyces sp. ID05-04B]|nr:hypothetical protein C6376_04250 [Streptomyces sp. P3]MDX5564941.1 hypothetical protein [Streptomyces sp. ID05-04B]
MSIIHALLRWILGVCAPGTGRRRAGARPPVADPARIAARPCCPAAARLPVPRSPYGLAEPLDGAATVPVRPYLLAAQRARAGLEREQARQSRRRAALVLAADFGIDLDQHVIGTERAA